MVHRDPVERTECPGLRESLVSKVSRDRTVLTERRALWATPDQLGPQDSPDSVDPQE